MIVVVHIVTLALHLLSLMWPRPFAWWLVGRVKGEGRRRVCWLWWDVCWLCRNAGRANQIVAWNLSHDFHVECVTRLWQETARWKN